ncbi:SH3 and multiple ankyrin repeat domains protein 2 isoform X6 [Sitodiplosis mosellana]|uniref:SH3 and multiple ankyrin repeat domains protein 2 isoform X6 n=1 Tax=Sitodiplosis mosellana TaxID=263140 RepID=UPI0024441D5C|nr:SH3 and multiple ankyrin repeat domains protein 2 isoform X6 [Sitodiplosis mosellana]
MDQSPILAGGDGFDDDPPPEPREGWLLVRVHVPELNVFKSLQFPSDRLVWDVKQQVLASLPKVAFWFRELKESFNYGLFCPPSNGKAGKFLDEERRLGDYPFNGPVGYLELKYKRRVYKMLNLDEKQLKSLHTRANLRRFLECINGGHVEKIAKMCNKGLDPNFHCTESGDTPLTLATCAKKPNKLLIALVNGGALLDYRTKDGATALHKAVETDCLEAVTTLLELGASPNYRDARGLTPLYLSVIKKTDTKICESLLHDHATLGTQDSQGWQEVHQACRHGLVHHLEHLLFYGADMDGRNASGNTSLHVCAVNNQEACARMLLFRGADRAALNYANQTPYQVAVIAGNLELAEMIQNYKPEDIDKSIGDTSDIISDSSGVGTNSDSAVCSIGHPSTTVVCIEPYSSSTIGHLSIQTGEVIEVLGSTDCGLLEGYVRGTNRSGFFPVDIVQEVNIRQKNVTNVSTEQRSTFQKPQPPPQQQQQNQMESFCQQQSPNQQQSIYQRNTIIGSDSIEQPLPDEFIGNGQPYSSATAPRQKKLGIMEAKTVVLHRAKRGFGFVLRGAKAASPLMQLKPTDRCPGLQYLDDVDPGGVADMAGLSPGDFLLAINGEDVRCASHEHVVDLIRSSGSLVTMTVVSQVFPNNFQQQQQQQQHFSSAMNARQCATLPRKMTLGGKLPAPMPPRRDPKTTLSVGRARAKSMVAGLEGDDDELPTTLKSSSVESVHQQSLSSASTPTQGGPGTPVQLRTASIKSRPTSSRITAAELVELFQRQTGGIGENRYSTMMCSSRFQSNNDTPPSSPQKGPIVYASVAEMKRKKNKMGTLKMGKPCATPCIETDLKRFHSTPDLATGISQSNASIFAQANGFKGHRSQDDMYSLHSSMQRLNLPPPNHPPPPPPIGQVVKVDVSRKSEYESTVQLQKQLQAKAINSNSADVFGSEIRSSFKPATNAKLYACPQTLRNVAYRTANEIAAATNEQNCQTVANQVQRPTANQYAQPIRAGTLPHPVHQRASLPQLIMPQIPDPDYSLSESDGEDENSVLVAHNTKMNERIAIPAETSGNSNASGSSSGSGGSIPHSFSVDEIQKMRVKLKSSKSYPNELVLNQQNTDRNDNDKMPSTKMLSKDTLSANHDECDNSSSGVSSDQEVTASNVKTVVKTTTAPINSNKIISTNPITENKHGILKNHHVTNKNVVTNAPHQPPPPPSNANNASTMAITTNTTTNVKIVESINKKAINLPPLSNVTKKISAAVSETAQNANNDDFDDFDDIPAKGFQRQVSLTRKQAANIAMNRQIYTRSAVSLAQLPPPLEGDSDDPDHQQQSECRKNNLKNARNIVGTRVVNASACNKNNNDESSPSSQDIVLAPPPEFSDSVCTNAKCLSTNNPGQAANMTGRSVRIVGAVPKLSRLQSH